MPRLFFGIEIAQDIKVDMRGEQQRLKASGIVADGWSNPDLLHVTSLFLGVVEEEVLPVLSAVGESISQSMNPFSLTTGAFGVFAKNKVLWLGFDERKSEMQSLVTLHQALKDALQSRLSIEFDARPYRAHLTLARKLKDATKLRKIPTASAHTFTATDLCLFESTRIDGQLQYPVRHRFPLGIKPMLFQSDDDGTHNI